MVVTIKYDNGVTRKVGDVQGDTLFCNRTVSKHLFRSGHASVKEARAAHEAAWGLDCKVCDGLLSRGVQWFVIRTESYSYRCELKSMKEAGFVLHMKPHRPQYFLNEERFERYAAK